MQTDSEGSPVRRRRPPEDPQRRPRPAEGAGERRRRPPDMEAPRRRPRQDDQRDGPEPGREAGIPAMAAAAAGVRQISELTGREAQGIVSLEPASDGWVVGVEVVEDHRIPSSSDMMAIYEAKLDEEGDLTAYTRKRRYPRGKNDIGEG
jgi:Gas vesicle synthesis protein GvpO